MTRIPFRAPLAAAIVVLAGAVPWALGFSGSHAAVANGVAFAMAFAPLALMVSALRPAAAVCALGGLWLAAAPWMLGYASAGTGAWAADVALGAALAVITWPARQQTAADLGRAEPAQLPIPREARAADRTRRAA